MLIAGAGALILVLSLWLRERVYEVGILLALGKSKISIFLQFCLEVVLVSLGALLPAFVAGNAITSYLLQTVLASGDQATLQDSWPKQVVYLTSPPILCRILCLSAPDWLLISSPFVSYSY